MATQLGRSEPPPGLATAQLKYLETCSGRRSPWTTRVIDCLEFDADLRQLDVAAEVGYFTMECRHVGLGRVARRCISEYHSRCPGCLGPGHLMDFYASLGATVRAGLMGWRALETPAAEEWRRRTAAYLKDAQHYIDMAGI